MSRPSRAPALKSRSFSSTSIKSGSAPGPLPLPRASGPGGPTGVQIDDYAEMPVKLVTVRKSFAK